MRVDDQRGAGASTVTEADVDDAIEGIVYRGLRSAMLGVALVLVVLALHRTLLLSAPHTFLGPLGQLTIVGGLVLGRWALGRWPVAARWGHTIAGAIGAAVVLSVLWDSYIQYEPSQTLVLALVIIAAGDLMVDSRWFVAVVALAAAGWWWIIAGAAPNAGWEFERYGLLVAILMGALVHFPRKQTLRDLERARLESEHQRKEIERQRVALRRAHDELERRVAERTQELTKANALLTGSQRELRALSARLATAQEEERRRIAREIHDELGQMLTSLRFALFGLQKGAPGERELLQVRLAEMSGLIDMSMAEVRKLCAALRPSVLDDLGLPEAIESHGKEFHARTGIEWEHHLDRDVAVTPAQATALFRIYQEALTNVMRHAQATKVSVSLTQDGGQVELTVRDDGRGIAPEESSSPQSLGLIGMRERAIEFGGDVTITSPEGKGTEVRTRIPLPAGADNASSR